MLALAISLVLHLALAAAIVLGPGWEVVRTSVLLADLIEPEPPAAAPPRVRDRRPPRPPRAVETPPPPREPQPTAAPAEPALPPRSTPDPAPAPAIPVPLLALTPPPRVAPATPAMSATPTAPAPAGVPAASPTPTRAALPAAPVVPIAPATHATPAVPAPPAAPAAPAVPTVPVAPAAPAATNPRVAPAAPADRSPTPVPGGAASASVPGVTGPSSPPSLPPRAVEGSRLAAPGPAVAVVVPDGVVRPATPRIGHQYRPAYPSSARRLGIQGTTLLDVLVAVDGSVAEVAVKESAGHPDLDQAAAAAVRRWRFEPARRGADPVATRVELPVEFRLR